MSDHVIIEQSPNLSGTVTLDGAKNAILVIMASLILTKGKSHITNVPASDDIYQMMMLLQDSRLLLYNFLRRKSIEVDTSSICRQSVSPDIMRKMRASILVMGPLLARYGMAHVALPGGCLLGARPIDYHIKALRKMGAVIDVSDTHISAHAHQLKAQRFILEYPSVGATENIMMAAVLTPGTTRIINAALEPEVLDLD